MKKIIISSALIFMASTALSASASAVCETTVPASTMTEEYEVETAAETTTAEILPGGRIYFENFSELYDFWYKTADSENAYPDYVCGVWSTDGGMEKLTVALVTGEMGQKGKEEILSLIENDESVAFTYKPYTYAELCEVKENITKHLIELTDSGIASSWGIGVYEMENVVHIDIDTTIPEVQELMAECEEKYGDMVAFEYSGSIYDCVANAGRVDVDGPEGTDIGAPIPAGGDIVAFVTDAPADKPDWYNTTAGASSETGLETGELITVTTTAQTADYKSSVLIWAAAAAIILLLTAAGIIAAKKKRSAQTTAGTIETAENISTAQVEAMLKITEKAPSGDTFEKIMKKIEE